MCMQTNEVVVKRDTRTEFNEGWKIEKILKDARNGRDAQADRGLALLHRE